MKEFAVYTAARLGLFLVAYVLVVGIFLLVNGGGPIPVLWPLLVAAGISMIASVYLLRAQRERFATAVQQRARRASEKFEEMRAKEDEPDT